MFPYCVYDTYNCTKFTSQQSSSFFEKLRLDRSGKSQLKMSQEGKRKSKLTILNQNLSLYCKFKYVHAINNKYFKKIH